MPAFPARQAWLRCCVRCGLMFASPQPDDAELDALYHANYYREFGYDDLHAAVLHRHKARWFDGLLSRAEQFATPGRLLDLGAGQGEMLLAARARGWRPLGVERNGAAVAVANRRLAGACRQASIEEFQEEAVEGG